ncbi:hypothetical protein DFH29DRAFT_876907 [Suillus ampliporus]|nr:hypothetical protein DFH29DRAFT_876907 [Suillus ampliporus]
MSVYEPDMMRKLLSALEPKDLQNKFESNWKNTVKKRVESWTGHNERMTNSRPKRQYEWEAEIVEYINYISDKTRRRSAKALARPYLNLKIPILGPHFVPPSYLHALRRNQSEPVVNPETLYLKPLRVIHPFYHPELARCPRCDCTDSVQWDGWTGTGPRDVHGLFVDEGAIGTQIRCDNCKNNLTSKKGQQQPESSCGDSEQQEQGHDSRTQLKGHCFSTTNPEFWHTWPHWSIPVGIPVFFRRCAVTRGLTENIRHEQSYLQALSPNPLQAFSDPGDKKNYNDKPISNDVITEVFQEFVSGMRERESEDYLWTLSGISVSFDNTFRAAGKASVTNQDKQKVKVLKGGIISLMNENGEIIGWDQRFCHGQSNVEITELLNGLKTRYAAVIINPSRNPHRKEVVAKIATCILKKHAEGKQPAEYWDQHEQEARLSSTFEKWSKEGTVWSGGARRQVHSSGITTFTALCHDFVLRRNIRVASSWEHKSDFLSSTHGSHHVHLVDRIAQLSNKLRLKDKSTGNMHPLPQLMQVPSMEHFGLVKSSFASTFGGLLDIKTEELDDPYPFTKLLDELANNDPSQMESILQSARVEVVEELDIDPRLLSMPEMPSKEPTADLEQPRSVKHKAQDADVVSDSSNHPQPPCKVTKHAESQSCHDKVPLSADVAAKSLPCPLLTTDLDQYFKPASRLPYRKTLKQQQLQIPSGVAPSAHPTSQDSTGTVSHPINQSSVRVADNSGDPTEHEPPPNVPDNRNPANHCLTPIAKPPGMTRSQHFFTIATRIDARAMQITGDTEFHLFMAMQEEFKWVSFKMTPRQWVLATETYNLRLEDRNHAAGLDTVKKNPQALLQKLGDIEVAVMTHIAKNDYKSRSGSDTFWKRHCKAVKLIKAEAGKKLRKAHMCSRCKTIMYPTPENSEENHRRGFCTDGAKQVSKHKAPPPWPQPPGIFSEGKHFHPRAFLETGIKQIYEQVFLRPSG